MTTTEVDKFKDILSQLNITTSKVQTQRLFELVKIQFEKERQELSVDPYEQRIRDNEWAAEQVRNGNVLSPKKEGE